MATAVGAAQLPAALLWGPFVVTAVVFATLGMGLWLDSALASPGLFGFVFGGAVLATYTGLIEQYEFGDPDAGDLRILRRD